MNGSMENDIAREKPEADAAEDEELPSAAVEEVTHLPDDAPEGDALEQQQEAAERAERWENPRVDREASEADLIEQAETVPIDDDYDF